MGKQTDTIKAVAAVNKTAREARRLCTDIIRQTSIKPYYGKYGAAALYAPRTEEAGTLNKIADAVAHLTAANDLLVDIAIQGGQTEAKLKAARIEETYSEL